MLHRARHLFIRQQTAVINSIRSQMAEFGIVAPLGRNDVEELDSIGGKERLGNITKQGKRYLAASSVRARAR